MMRPQAFVLFILVSVLVVSSVFASDASGVPKLDASGKQEAAERGGNDQMPCKWPIPVEKSKASPHLYTGRFEDWQLNQGTENYLEIKAELAEHILIKAVPVLIKIAAPDKIESLISPPKPDIQVYSGVFLTLTDKLLGGIPNREGYKYFKLEKAGPYWKDIESSKEFVIYVPISIESMFIYGARDCSSRSPAS